MCAIFFFGCMCVTGEGGPTGRLFTWFGGALLGSGSDFCSEFTSSFTAAKSPVGATVSSGGLVIGLILILIGFGAILTTQQSSSSSISGSEKLNRCDCTQMH